MQVLINKHFSSTKTIHVPCGKVIIRVLSLTGKGYEVFSQRQLQSIFHGISTKVPGNNGPSVLVKNVHQVYGRNHFWLQLKPAGHFDPIESISTTLLSLMKTYHENNA